LKLMLLVFLVVLLVGCSNEDFKDINPVERVALENNQQPPLTSSKSGGVYISEESYGNYIFEKHILEIIDTYDFSTLKWTITNTPTFTQRFKIQINISSEKISESKLVLLHRYALNKFNTELNQSRGEFVGDILIDLDNGYEIALTKIDQLWWNILYRDNTYSDAHMPEIRDWWTIASGVLNVQTLETERWRKIDSNQNIVSIPSSPFN